MPITWGDIFETVQAEAAAPSLTPGEVCAAHFATLREVLTEKLPPLEEGDLF